MPCSNKRTFANNWRRAETGKAAWKRVLARVESLGAWSVTSLAQGRGFGGVGGCHLIILTRSFAFSQRPINEYIKHKVSAIKSTRTQAVIGKNLPLI